MNLEGHIVAFLVAPEGVEQVELTEPWEAVEQAGGVPRLVSTQSGHIQAYNHLDKGDTFTADSTVNVTPPEEFHALVLPGGRHAQVPCGELPQVLREPRSPGSHGPAALAHRHGW